MNRENRIKKFILWGFVIGWMVLIFSLSAQPSQKSSQLSGGITDVVIETVETVIPEVEINRDNVSHLIRKNAHFFAYLILGIFMIMAIKQSVPKLTMKMYGLAFILCVIYAISDEFHQLYVPGRSGEVRDVLIDSTGAFVGLLIYRLIQLVPKVKRNIRN